MRYFATLTALPARRPQHDVNYSQSSLAKKDGEIKMGCISVGGLECFALRFLSWKNVKLIELKISELEPFPGMLVAL